MQYDIARNGVKSRDQAQTNLSHGEAKVKSAADSL